LAEDVSFEALVSEAFIDPLRSVLIVDDQYPTWEEIFNSRLDAGAHSEAVEANSKNKKWSNETATANEVFNLVKEFRRRKPGLIIDIHDGVSTKADEKTAGSETPDQLADHLHQSDLLILDYNLEGPEAGTGGDLARKILNSVLSNQHFNLVVVHTSEVLEDVFNDSLLSLMCSCRSRFGERILANIETIQAQLDELEESPIGEVLGCFDKAMYIGFRSSEEDSCNKAIGEYIRGQGSFAALSNVADALKLKAGDKRNFFFWALSQYEKSIEQNFCSQVPPKSLSWKNEGAQKWLRTSRGFVCFVSKGPKNLLKDLLTSLVDWKPSPSRLISAKYRDEMSRKGADVEDEALLQNYAHAKFYDVIKKPTNNENLNENQINGLRRLRLREHVGRQSEMLSFLIEDQVAKFGSKVYQCDVENGDNFASHYGVDLGNVDQLSEAVARYNRHICCLPSKQTPDGTDLVDQLDSGHIFQFKGAWWVCATPACDLQLGQTKIAFSESGNSSLRPFTALQLQKVPDPKTLTADHINSGTYCFIEVSGNVIGLGVKDPAKDVGEPANSKVTWRSMIAKNGGGITNGQLRILDIKLDGDQIAANDEPATVHAKLRYEYALNFIQRVGGSVSRIGLGYVT
jgi:hypothetical protein